MTDEEKAEEILQTKGCMTFCAKGCGYTEKVIYLIAIGLAEGRKELEKENAELKSEIKQIIERERVVPEHYLCEMIEKNKELKAQIKKLRCCKEEIINSIKSENADIEWVKAHNGVAKFIFVQTVIDIINDKWELAE